MTVHTHMSLSDRAFFVIVLLVGGGGVGSGGGGGGTNRVEMLLNRGKWYLHACSARLPLLARSAALICSLFRCADASL